MDFQQDTISENLAYFLNKIYVKIEVQGDLRNGISMEEYRKKLNAKFGLDINFEYEVIESCYWLIEDTEIALREFTEFGLQGPTRIKTNIGEKYLRLYGILNAVNLQKSVIIQLYEIFKIKNKKEIINRFKEVEIIKLRNKIAAHNVDYFENGSRDFFRISRRTLDHEFDGIHVIGKKGLEEFNLNILIEEFKVKFDKELFEICEFLIQKFFKQESNNFKELREILDLIKERLNGNIVISNPMENGYTILTTDIERIINEN